MTHTSDPSPAAPSTPGASATPADREAPESPARWASVRVSALAAGASAAGLGLGVPATIVLLLWIASPYPDSGLSGALHIGAGLWLLAQGAELVRADTLSGAPAPLAVAPLLLSAVAGWLVFRGTASAVGPDDESGSEGGGEAVAGAEPLVRDPRGAEPLVRDLRGAAVVAGWVLAGYLTVAAVAVAFTVGGPVRVAPLTALYVPLFAAVAAACGAWSGCGRPPLARRLGLPVRYGEEAVAALRAAGIAAGVLLGGGALLAGASLAWHAGASGRTYGQLSGPIGGKTAVFLLAVALVPNMAVWAASYGLGVGFRVGAGSMVAPAGVHGLPRLPAFPLLAALPGGQSWIGWIALALPVAAAGAVAWTVGNAGFSAWRTLRVVCGAAVFYGIGLAVAAAWAGGALGRSAMADVGPTWWLAGPAATSWTLVLALPASLVLRWHIGHPRPAPSSSPRRFAFPRRRPTTAALTARRPRLPRPAAWRLPFTKRPAPETEPTPPDLLPWPPAPPPPLPRSPD